MLFWDPKDWDRLCQRVTEVGRHVGPLRWPLPPFKGEDLLRVLAILVVQDGADESCSGVYLAMQTDRYRLSKQAVEFLCSVGLVLRQGKGCGKYYLPSDAAIQYRRLSRKGEEVAAIAALRQPICRSWVWIPLEPIIQQGPLGEDDLVDAWEQAAGCGPLDRAQLLAVAEFLCAVGLLRLNPLTHTYEAVKRANPERTRDPTTKDRNGPRAVGSDPPGPIDDRS